VPLYCHSVKLRANLENDHSPNLLEKPTESLGRARRIALRAAEKTLFGLFRAPHTSQIRRRHRIARTLFGQFQKWCSPKSKPSILHNLVPLGREPSTTKSRAAEARLYGFLDVFDAFEVETVYLSGDPKGTLTYNTFLRGAREEGSEVEEVRAGYLMDWGGGAG
jgi:hypothetical protein